MKYFLSIIFFSLSGFAQSFQPVLTQEELDSLKSKYEWLMPILMEQKHVQASGEEKENVENTFYPHFKDSLKYFPNPSDWDGSKLNLTKPRHITGSITYVGIFPKDYHYDVIPENGGFTLEVRIHFKKITPELKEIFKERLKLASQIWTNNQIDLGVPYQFRFLLEENKKTAHYSVALKDDTRGPYDTEWSIHWRETTVAHEVGHMLGVGDEYGTLTQHNKCLRESLMCSSYTGAPLKLHYYHVLRRLFATASTQKSSSLRQGIYK